MTLAMPSTARTTGILSYASLVRSHPLRMITNSRQLKDAQVLVDRILDAPRRSQEVTEYLRVLGFLIHDYESKTLTMEHVHADEMLSFLMENRSISQAQLAKNVGIATSTISEIISGKRKLTRKQIEKLSAYFKVSPAVFHTTIN